MTRVLLRSAVGMKLIIDGYNVLKMMYPAAQVDEHERERFIARIARYARVSGNMPYIVFDGGDDIRPVFLHQKNVVVVYSGYRESADTVIKGLLEEEQRNEVLLISTDRELNKYAENFDIPSMDSVVFYGYVRDRLSEQEHDQTRQRSRVSPKGEIKKFAGRSSSPELDALMEEAAGKVMYKDEQEYAQAGRHASHKSKKDSKLTKRLEALVKKL